MKKNWNNHKEIQKKEERKNVEGNEVLEFTEYLAVKKMPI